MNKKILEINDMLEVYHQCKELLDQKQNILLFLDIDDTVLSSEIGKKVVDKNIRLLIELIYRQNPEHLFFLTARESDLNRKTLNQLNNAKLVHDGKFIRYKIIHSPYDKQNNVYVATKGKTLMRFLQSNSLISDSDSIWIVFVDDDVQQIISVKQCLDELPNINYTLYHFLP